MGFLDRMVGNLVSDATGIDRRLVRKLVGNKSLMMLGAGAALGGGAMAGLAGKQQPGSSTGPSTWDNPNRIEQATGTAQPPPPPPRSQGTTPPKPPGERTAPPPPPPPPPGTVPPTEDAEELTDEAAPDADAVEKTAEELEEPIEDQLPRELTYGLVRTMVAAALADGDLSDDERDMIHGQLDESSLEDDEVKQIQRDLVLPPSVQDLAEMAGEEEAWKESMYRFAGFVILSDDKVSDLERSWLDRLAGALGFTDEQKEALETEIFAAG